MFGKRKDGQAYRKDQAKPLTGVTPETREPSEKEKKLKELGALTLSRKLKENNFTSKRFAVEMSDNTQSRDEVLRKFDNDANEIIQSRINEQKKIEELKNLDSE